MYSQSTINFCSVSSVLSFLSCQLIGFLDVLRVSYQSFSGVLRAGFYFLSSQLIGFPDILPVSLFDAPPHWLFLAFFLVDWLPGCTPGQLSIVVRCPSRGFSSFPLS